MITAEDTGCYRNAKCMARTDAWKLVDDNGCGHCVKVRAESIYDEFLKGAWRRKANMLCSMIRSCRVTVQDMEGVAHTVEVTAESLYEAVAQGLAALRGREWVAGITHGSIKVSVADVRVEHEVKMTEFAKWLDRPGGSPREVIQRQKVRSILGMPVQTS